MLNTSLPVEVLASADDKKSLENSDDSFSLTTGSESEDDEFDDDNYTIATFQAGKEIVVYEDSGDDDFVEPPKKKVMLKESNVGSMTDFLETFQKGISIDQVYGYDDIEPMFGDDR